MMWRVLFDVFVDVDDGGGWATGGRITRLYPGNYYHWWIMNKSYYYYSWGTCPHLFFLYVLFHLQYRPWMAGVDGDGGTEVL